MPKDMSHYTALARRAVGDHVRAAVPASRRSTNTWDNAVLAAVPWVPPRTTIGPQVLVFDDAAVDEHRFRFLHLGIGPRIERHPLEDALACGDDLVGLQANPLFIPLHGLRTSRYRGDDAVSGSLGVRDYT